MGPLKNSRHEAFARALFAGKNATDAYMEAGFTAKGPVAQASASRLAKTASIVERLRELHATATTRVEITKQWLEEQVLDLAVLAKKEKQLAVARGCYEMLGRDRAAFQERKTITVRRLADLSSEELEEIIASGEHTAAPPGKGSRGS